MNWIPNDYRNPAAGHAPAASDDLPTAGSPGVGPCGEALDDGAGHGGPPPVGPAPERSGGLPDLSPVALAAGLVGLLTGPLLVGDPTARYAVLAADLVAVTFGVLGVWVSLKRFGRLDYAVAAIVMGAVSLFLWVQYVSDPPQGGT
jgi:hypothetical protein